MNLICSPDSNQGKRTDLKIFILTQLLPAYYVKKTLFGSRKGKSCAVSSLEKHFPETKRMVFVDKQKALPSCSPKQMMRVSVTFTAENSCVWLCITFSSCSTKVIHRLSLKAQLCPSHSSPDPCFCCCVYMWPFLLDVFETNALIRRNKLQYITQSTALSKCCFVCTAASATAA